MTKSNDQARLNTQDLVFYIKVQFRCNSSMQGTIHWLDGKKSQKFRSVLELGSLIHDARAKNQSKDISKLGAGSWEEKEIVS